MDSINNTGIIHNVAFLKSEKPSFQNLPKPFNFK